MSRNYETDLAAWSEEQAERLRQHSTEIDWDNIAEEIDSLGRSDKRALKHRFEVLLAHWLKWEYQPEKRSPGWLGTILEQQSGLRDLLEESPSLKAQFNAEMRRERYRRARAMAIKQTGMVSLPEEYPFTFDVLTTEPEEK